MAKDVSPQQLHEETKDVLGRERQIQALTTLISTRNKPFVLGIDSPFGTGKTFFISLWRKELKRRGFKSVLFNAWESDFTENALISMLGEFRIAALEWQRKSTSWEKSMEKVSGALAKKAGPILLKALTKGISEDFGKALEEFAEKQIKDYKEDKNTIANFRKELESFVQKVSPAKPIVFFIDELDRCRPLFAIEVLENAKHLFSVQGVVFVLGIAKNQLSHSVRAVYGSEFDSTEYLRRFIDFEFRLPPPAFENFIQMKLEYHGFNKLVMGKKPHGLSEVSFVFSAFSNLFDLSLRKLDQAIYHFCFLVQFGKVERVDPKVCALLAVMRIANHESYCDYIRGKSNIDLLNQLKSAKERGKPDKQAYYDWLITGLKVLNMSEDDFNKWSEVQRSIVSGSEDCETGREVLKTGLEWRHEKGGFERATQVLEFVEMPPEGT